MALGEPPIEAALACLNSEGISIDNISAISIGMDWGYRNKIYEMTKEEQEKYEILTAAGREYKSLGFEFSRKYA